MSKVYIVMDSDFVCGEILGPDIVGVFDSRKKAIDFINDDWKDYIVLYRRNEDDYSYEDKYGCKHLRFIEEHEIK